MSKGESDNLKIYLDNCCYNRPYDQTGQISVHLEALAKLSIQTAIRNGPYELVSSEVLIYEIRNHPIEMTRNAILGFLEEYSSIHVGKNSNTHIDDAAHKIMEQGIKYKDACHVASAIYAGCDYFLSTDKRLLKYKTDRIKMRNPVDFIREMEDEDER